MQRNPAEAGQAQSVALKVTRKEGARRGPPPNGTSVDHGCGPPEEAVWHRAQAPMSGARPDFSWGFRGQRVLYAMVADVPHMRGGARYRPRQTFPDRLRCRRGSAQAAR
jgi:hypothetical protein